MLKMAVTRTVNALGVVGPTFLRTSLPESAFERTSIGEWIARLRDSPEVVVPDTDGRPDATCVAKAASILRSRMYLQQRALELLHPLAHADGDWRLVTLDFGAAAQRARCEFLMCFAFQLQGQALSIDSPYAEVSSELLPQGSDRPSFMLMLRTLPEKF
ncbi:MAG: hypothetical protein JWQ07_4748 [Ramlibacter sp.]|nr:hypothetical protein [Ramlibacter sp.]